MKYLQIIAKIKNNRIKALRCPNGDNIFSKDR